MFLDTIAGETALLRAIISHRPVGPTKHFEMISVLLSIKENAGKEYEAESISGKDVWNKMNDFWDLPGIEDGLEETDSQGSSYEGSDRHLEFDPLSLPIVPEIITSRSLATKSDPTSSPIVEEDIESNVNQKSKQKEPVPGQLEAEDYAGGESDESELTEQEDDGDENESEEDAPSPPSKRARSTRSVSVATSESTPASASKRAKVVTKKVVSKRAPGKRATHAPRR